MEQNTKSPAEWRKLTQRSLFNETDPKIILQWDRNNDDVDNFYDQREISRSLLEVIINEANYLCRKLNIKILSVEIFSRAIGDY